MIDFAPIRTVLEDYPYIEKAVLFGSRAMGTHKQYSDIDIALFGNIEPDQASQIAEDLEELPMIQKFDVLVYERVNNLGLREHIDKVGQVIFERQ